MFSSVLKPSQLNQWKTSLACSAPVPAPSIAPAGAKTTRGILSSQPSGRGPWGTVLQLQTVSIFCQMSAPCCWNNSQPSQPPPASSLSIPQVQKELVWGWGRRELSLDPPERHSFSLVHQETLKYSFCEGVSGPVI